MGSSPVQLVAVVLALSLATPAATFESEPPDEYFSEHFHRDAHYWFSTMDMNGDRVASFVVEDGRSYVVVFDAASMTSYYHALGVVDASTRLVGLGWMDDDSIVIETREPLRYRAVGMGGEERVHVAPWNGTRVDRTYLVDVLPSEGDEVISLRVHLVALHGSVVSTSPQDDEHILARFDGDRGSVHRIEPRSLTLKNAGIEPFDRRTRTFLPDSIGRRTRVAHLRADPSVWRVGPQGTVQLAGGMDGDEYVIWFRPPDHGGWREVIRYRGVEAMNAPVPVGLSEDGRKIIVLATPEGRDKAALFELDPKAGALGALLFEHSDADVVDAIRDGGTSAVVGAVVLEGGLPRNYYFRSPEASVDWLERRFEGRSISIVSKSHDGGQIVAFVSSATDPGSFYLFDADARRLMLFGKRMPWIDPTRMADVSAFWVQAPGGPRVEAFLSVPPGVERPHLVVVPHGGPLGVADDRTFDPFVQQLASRGYAVLKVNYRGSGGYGSAFAERGRGEWGLGIEDDIEAAIDDVVRRGLVREDRMCAVGGSYGGYSALMMLLRSPERFACGVAIAGVTDLALWFSTADWSMNRELRDLQAESVGDPVADYELLKARSPVYRAAEFDAPVLIVHGAEDRRVDVEHGARLRAMLRVHGKPHRFVVLDGEGHSPSNVGFQRIYAIVGSFLDDQIRGPLFEGELAGSP